MGLHLVVASLVGCAVAATVLTVVLALLVLRWRTAAIRRRQRQGSIPRPLVGLFHPHSTGGGGGERVLWALINALMEAWPNADFVVYSHFDSSAAASPDEIQSLVVKKFGISLKRTVEVVQLDGIAWVEPRSYPRLTLILQSMGALPLAWEAISARPCDVFIDSMGFAFTYPLVRLVGGCSVGCYVHYPTVSSDMLSAVRSRREAHNNAGLVGRSLWLTNLKVVYYRLFAWIYGWCGRWSQAVVVNSSWTRGHIADIWKLPVGKVHRVYPPCDVRQLLELNETKENSVISVAQFRPEKDHKLQLEAFRVLTTQRPADRTLKLHLVGGVRNEDDQRRVAELRSMAKEKNLEHQVVFHVDLPYPQLKDLLARSAVGLHTMWNEHFGIGIVEYMAAGCIPVAHNSGGPKMDIVEPAWGFLAETASEFADAMAKALTLPLGEQAEMRGRGREASQRFSEEAFAAGCCAAFKPLWTP